MGRSIDIADGSVPPNYASVEAAHLCEEAEMKDSATDMVRLSFELPRNPRIREETIKILTGVVLDILKSREIREILVASAGARDETAPSSHSQPNLGATSEQEDGVRKRKTWKVWIWNIVIQIMEYKGDWMKDTRGAIMTVASLISTITFQAAIAPPGGVWQSISDCEANNKYIYGTKYCETGMAVGAFNYETEFTAFLLFDMISFTGSVIVMFLLISGFPLSNKFALWVLSLVMCVTITFLGLAFFLAVWILIPDEAIGHYNQFTYPIIIVSVVVVALVVLFLLIRLSSWLQSKNFKPALRKLFGFCSAKVKLCSNA